RKVEVRVSVNHPVVSKKLEDLDDAQQLGAKRVSATLQQGENAVSIVAVVNGLESERIGLRVDYQVPTVERKGETLHLLSVGVSEYPNLPSAENLRYADADAKEFTEAIQT